MLLAVLVFAETALLAGYAVFLFAEFFVETPASFGSAIAILLLTLVAAIWLLVLGVNTLRGAPWVRAGVVVWQVLQIAVGVGFLQGEFAVAPLGWALIIPAAVALVLVFTPSVRAATMRRDELGD